MLMKDPKFKIYRKWYEFHRGTTDPEYAAWHTYGRLGIKMCPQWHDYHTFLDYVIDQLGEAPSPRHVLHRKNSLKDFKPGNLEWNTKKVMNNSRRDCRYITYKGRKQSLTAWCEELGVNYMRAHSRLRIGWTVKRALETL